MSDALRFKALYLTRFAGGFGAAVLLTLLPTYINVLNPSGFLIGMFTSGLTIAQTLAVVPLAWAGDRYDKRLVLIGSLLVGLFAYAGFGVVDSSWGFVFARGAQGIVLSGLGLMGLALVGELATEGTRANHIGKANAWSFAAAITGTLSAGYLYGQFGLQTVFGVIVALFVVTTAAVVLFVPPDTTRVKGFPFSDLALNRRLITITGFRAQYAVAVTLVRTWVPIYAGVAAARGGLAYSALAVGLVITTEKFANMLCQPFMGRFSDRVGRAPFVALGGGLYGLVALLVPFTPAIGSAVGFPETYPYLGPLSAAFVPLLLLNAGLGFADSMREPASMALFADEGSKEGGVASSFGVRNLVWRPGSIVAPMLGGWLMASVGMQWVFYLGGAAALSGVAVFLLLLVRSHGTEALSTW